MQIFHKSDCRDETTTDLFDRDEKCDFMPEAS